MKRSIYQMGVPLVFFAINFWFLNFVGSIQRTQEIYTTICLSLNKLLSKTSIIYSSVWYIAVMVIICKYITMYISFYYFCLLTTIKLFYNYVFVIQKFNFDFFVFMSNWNWWIILHPKVNLKIKAEFLSCW